jgi:hypothetical protein
LPTTFRPERFGSSVSIILLLASVAMAAVPPSDTLLPRTTKGYLSIARPKEFDDRWNKTQIGQMFNDDVMKAFVDDFKKQMRDDFGAIEKKLGLTYDDLKGVTGGEMSLSLIERKGQDAALAITIDVTGHQKQGEEMIAAAANRFAKRNGRRSTANVDGTRFEIFSVPTGGRAQQTIYFIKNDLLCGIDDRAEAERILRRTDGNAKDNLASVNAYQVTMEKCRRQAGKLEPEARWFVDPFGFIFADRTLHEPSKKDQDLAKILYNNGFDAIQGAGGFLNQLVDGHIEILSRTAVYAPPVRGKENDPLRWNSSMQMMQMPNGPPVEPQSFAPRELAAYITLNINLMDAFDHVGPVFDALQDHEDAWKNTIAAWRDDPYGQQVDVRKEFIANMNNRVTVMSSYDIPITEESERSVFAIEAKDEAALAKTLDRWMAKEADVVKHQVGQYVIYEHVAKENSTSEPDVDAIPGFSQARDGSDEKSVNEKKRKERVLPNSAVTVALGHLMMASDVQYLTEILQSFGRRERLASSADYQQMTEVMNRLVPGERSGWIFGRSDEELRPTFDLIRQGKMPQSKSMLGKLLNKMLTTAEEEKQGTPRRQRVNGANLPDFEMVRRYFGPHASVVKSEKDGWFITATLLNKEAP